VILIKFICVAEYTSHGILNTIYSHSNSLLSCNDSAVILSDLTGNDVSTHFSHEGTLNDVKTCDMKIFVTLGNDKIIRVWDIAKEDIQTKLPTQEKKIRYSRGEIYVFI
jgi:WD40 repeat protein